MSRVLVEESAVKNNFGLLAGAQKSWYDYYSVEPEVFANEEKMIHD